MAGDTADTRRYFDTNQIDIPSAGTRVRVARLSGGGTLTIRAHTGNAGDVYVGDDDVSSSNGFILGPGESIEIVYAPGKEKSEFIDVHVDAANDGDDISYIYIE